MSDAVDGVVEGDHRAIARAISTVEDRRTGYRELLAGVYPHTGDAAVVGVTGSPGAGKSTLVDGLVEALRGRGETVGVLAVDPASPYTGGAVLGDRVRLGAAGDDPGVFFRSMSARGSTGGLAVATADAVAVLDAAGTDVVVVETVGAGQNEVEVVGAADSVVVVLQPASGDDVQMLKAGILEIGDVFVVNKADLGGADATVRDVREMLDVGRAAGGDPAWTPPVLETVATDGAGLAELLGALDDHRAHLVESGRVADRRRERIARSIRSHLRERLDRVVERELAGGGGLDALVAAVLAGETDPASVAADLVGPIEAGTDAAEDDA